MKKNFKRWLALVLAVTMVAGTCLSHADGFLSATDGEPAVTQDGETAVADQTEGGTGQPVEEQQEIVIPKQEEQPPVEQEVVQEGQPVQEEPAGAETLATQEAPTEETPAEEVPAEQEVQEEPVDEQEVFYQVVFHRPAVDGGTLYVWSEGEEAQEASYAYDQYVKDAAEGTTLYFRIQNAGNFLVDRVTDQNGLALAPESTTENTSTYKMVVSGNNEITISYRSRWLQSN